MERADRRAFEILKAFWERHPAAELRDTVLLSISLVRLPSAIDFLLTLLAEARSEAAAAALTALAIHRFDARVRERISATVAERKDAALRDLFAKKFPADD